MGDLGSDAAKIVPYAAQNGVDIGIALLRKGRPEVGAADPLLGQPRPDYAHDGAGDIAHDDAVAAVKACEQQRCTPSRDRVHRLLEAMEHQPATLLPGQSHGAKESFWSFRAALLGEPGIRNHTWEGYRRTAVMDSGLAAPQRSEMTTLWTIRCITSSV